MNGSQVAQDTAHAKQRTEKAHQLTGVNWPPYRTLHGIGDGQPLRALVDGNVRVPGCCQPDGLCRFCCGHLVIVSEGGAFDGRCALYGDEEVLSWQQFYLFCCDEADRSRSR